MGPSGAFTRRHSRRDVLRGVGLAALGALGGVALPRVGAADAASPGAAVSGVPLPPDRGQSERHVFVAPTGHTLRGTMLDYWRANGAAAVYGHPISEPFASAGGYYSQAFENAVFQYRPEFVDGNDPIIRLMPIGQAVAAALGGTGVADGRRAGGGGVRELVPWQPLAPTDRAVAAVVDAGGLFAPETGHTLHGAFLQWFGAHEGDFYLGPPLSEPFRWQGAAIQVFSGGVLRQRADGSVNLAPIARQLAAPLGLDTAPVPQEKLPTYSEALFQADGIPPSPTDLANAGQDGTDYLQFTGDLAAPGRRRVEVSLSKEQLWAYQGETAVMTTPVSTGLAPNLTAPGDFHVRIKFGKQTMAGFTGETGEVVGFGATPPPGGGSKWEVPNIPNVMYFNTSAEALHGCYWHHNFGNPMSHGCVNLPLQVAAWMYGWAPLGTQVTIRA